MTPTYRERALSRMATLRAELVLLKIARKRSWESIASELGIGTTTLWNFHRRGSSTEAVAFMVADWVEQNREAPVDQG